MSREPFPPKPSSRTTSFTSFSAGRIRPAAPSKNRGSLMERDGSISRGTRTGSRCCLRSQESTSFRPKAVPWSVTARRTCPAVSGTWLRKVRLRRATSGIGRPRVRRPTGTPMTAGSRWQATRPAPIVKPAEEPIRAAAGIQKMKYPTVRARFTCRTRPANHRCPGSFSWRKPSPSRTTPSSRRAT